MYVYDFHINGTSLQVWSHLIKGRNHGNKIREQKIQLCFSYTSKKVHISKGSKCFIVVLYLVVVLEYIYYVSS